MSGTGRIEVVGVHPVEITRATLLENARLEFGDGRFNLDDLLYELNDDEFDERFRNTYLIEMKIEPDDSLFDPSQLTQEAPGRSPDSWQVAYDEKYLDPDGVSVRPKPAPGDEIRLAFFFHSLNLKQPLLTPYGATELPVPTVMPPRLRELFRYVPPC